MPARIDTFQRPTERIVRADDELMLVVGFLQNHLDRSTFDELAVLVHTHAASRIRQRVELTEEWCALPVGEFRIRFVVDLFRLWWFA